MRVQQCEITCYYHMQTTPSSSALCEVCQTKLQYRETRRAYGWCLSHGGVNMLYWMKVQTKDAGRTGSGQMCPPARVPLAMPCTSSPGKLALRSLHLVWGPHKVFLLMPRASDALVRQYSVQQHAATQANNTVHGAYTSSRMQHHDTKLVYSRIGPRPPPHQKPADLVSCFRGGRHSKTLTCSLDSSQHQQYIAQS